MKQPADPGQPFSEEPRKALVFYLLRACWIIRLGAADIVSAWVKPDDPEHAELIHAVRQVASLAGELLHRSERPTLEEFPLPPWLKKYTDPQPLDLAKKKGNKKRPRA